jgi:hypothetical protein
VINLALLNKQQRRILTQLRLGDIRQQDFDLPNVIDGGKPIKRVAARVGELIHKFGCDIKTNMVDASDTGDAKVGSYRLVSEPESFSSAGSVGSAVIGTERGTEGEPDARVVGHAAVTNAAPVLLATTLTAPFQQASLFELPPDLSSAYREAA